MPTTIPAIAGRIGKTEYWVTTMKAKEMCERLVIPKEMEGWEDISLEERYQRDIDLARVRREIAPYFANDENRFTGSLIVAIQNPDGIEFEEVTEVAPNMPSLYKQSARGLGLLTLSGGEILVPLDGQHRTKAIKYAITGRDDNNNDLDRIDGNSEIARDDIVIILVKYDPEVSRRIFNKVNRYARPTSKGQNLITDDDDVVAVIVRRNVVGELIDPRLVSFRSSSLNRKAREFTTLSTLYEGSQSILKAKGHKPDKSRPDSSKEQIFRKEIVDTWKALFEGMDVVRLAIADPGEAGDEKRREIRKDSILGRPIGQLATVRAAMTLRHDSRFEMPMAKVIAGLNRVPWDPDASVWQGVLRSGTKMKSGRTAAVLAGDLIAYMVAGNNFTDDEAKELEKKIQSNLAEPEAAEYRLPDPIGL